MMAIAIVASSVLVALLYLGRRSALAVKRNIARAKSERESAQRAKSFVDVLDV